MIEVLVIPTGDTAEAESPDAALVAAVTLLTEAKEHGCGTPRAAFYVQGKLVRCDVSISDLEDAALRMRLQ